MNKTIYPIHPIAAIYPPLPERKFSELKEHIRVNGQQNAIVLYEDQVLDGVHRERACKELDFEARYDRPEIKDPIAYVIGQNLRRDLTTKQRARMAAELANMTRGGDTRSDHSLKKRNEKITQSQAAKMLNVSVSSVQAAKREKRASLPQEALLRGMSETQLSRLRYVETHGISELISDIEGGTITICGAVRIARLPKKEQKAALAKQPRLKRTKRVKPELSAEESAREQACLEVINAPSIFPVDAPIPQADEQDERELRNAIKWAREHEPLIASFSKQRCNELLRCTNRIADYNVNFGHHPRLEGEIDQRILDWKQSLWIKRERQEERVERARKARARAFAQNPVSAAHPALRPPASFEERFEVFWMQTEDSLERRFKPTEKDKLVRAFRDEVNKLFSGISAGKGESCHGGNGSLNQNLGVVAST
jgi:hypothetical protein